MRILHFFLFAILLKNVYCHSSNPLLKPNAEPTTNTKLAKVRPQAPAPQVTSYILAVTWPTGACTGNSGIKCEITPVPTEFIIHGLWPNPNGPPSYEIFEHHKLDPIKDDLNKNWPYLGCEQQWYNLIFWGREWYDHGRYSALEMLEYFNKTLVLFKGAGEGLKGKLVAEKITPTLYKKYTLEAIEAALKKINGGFSCTVICNERKTSEKEKQIQEIRFRYTKDFKMQNNPDPSNCGTATTDVMFPPQDNKVVSMAAVHRHPL